MLGLGRAAMLNAPSRTQPAAMLNTPPLRAAMLDLVAVLSSATVTDPAWLPPYEQGGWEAAMLGTPAASATLIANLQRVRVVRAQPPAQQPGAQPEAQPEVPPGPGALPGAEALAQAEVEAEGQPQPQPQLQPQPQPQPQPTPEAAADSEAEAEAEAEAEGKGEGDAEAEAEAQPPLPVAEAETCAVCLEDYEQTVTTPVVMLPCAHCYHEPCARRWLEGHGTCPTCR
jgi:hypothetical protein